jgi:hypothetical protein
MLAPDDPPSVVAALVALAPALPRVALWYGDRPW